MTQIFNLELFPCLLLAFYKVHNWRSTKMFQSKKKNFRLQSQNAARSQMPTFIVIPKKYKTNLADCSAICLQAICFLQMFLKPNIFRFSPLLAIFRKS